MAEFQLTTETMKRFRMAYLAEFGANTKGDTLYEAVSEGRRHAGMEHWLPLFHERMDTLFDYLAERPLPSRRRPRTWLPSASPRSAIITPPARRR